MENLLRTYTRLKNKERKGFTLVELLVVIAILAVLASVSVVGYLGFTTKAKNSNALTELAQVREVIRAELIDGKEVNGTYQLESSDTTMKMKYDNKVYYIGGTKMTAGSSNFEDKDGTAFKALFSDLNDLKCTITVSWGNAEAVASEASATGYYKVTRIDYARTDGGNAYWDVSNDSLNSGEYKGS